MPYKTKQEWQSLIVEFEKSGLTQAAFCRQYSLNAKYFSLKRSKLLNSSLSTASQFVRVDNASQPSLKSPLIHLHFGSAKLLIDSHIAPSYLAQLIRALT
jgi:hypothetical protein